MKLAFAGFLLLFATTCNATSLRRVEAEAATSSIGMARLGPPTKRNKLETKRHLVSGRELTTPLPPLALNSTPGETPTCTDSTKTFLVNADIGDRDCAFLMENMDRFDYLCLFFDVALACPDTCDVCDALEAYCEPSPQCFQSNEELRDGIEQFFSGDEPALEALYGPIENWCFSDKVTDMSRLFEDQPSFNRGISGWNVQHITNMEAMFSNAKAFNQNLNSWNVSSVINMKAMFFCYYSSPAGSCEFNQPLDAWDTSSVTNMNRMFFFNLVFNQPLNGWNVESVTDMGNMFAFARSFDQPLNAWDVSSVTDMGGMFYSLQWRTAFDQDLCAWGPLLQGRSVVFRDPEFGRDMFALTNCPSEQNPDLMASPPGPFCHICT